MIIFITGAGHTGKTRLAQIMMEKLRFPYLSQDHLKMGLIRSGLLNASPEDPDEKLAEALWPVTREIAKTAAENEQNLIIEGCYIPFDRKKDFSEPYLKNMRFICLCLSDEYIDAHFDAIKAHASCIERRLDDGYLTPELVRRENRRFRTGCEENDLPYILIRDNYEEEVLKAFDMLK